MFHRPALPQENVMSDLTCAYCRDWNAAHPDEPARTACGPCDHCQAPGHIGAHPRQACSVCLCETHWAEISKPGLHFDLSHIIVIIVLGFAAASLWPIIARWW
jgi:hypothetical protein